MYIRVNVTADAKRESWKKVAPDRFVVSVTEPATRQLANRRVKELIARYFRLAPASVRLISGHHHPHKIFALPDQTD
jgi:uncharacterized protein YggU (UPF0235/DUF167 family)